MTPSRNKAQAAFVSAVLLLFLSALAGFFSIRRLLETQHSVIHTHEVRSALADLDSAMLRMGRARASYLTFETDDFLTQFEASVPEIPRDIDYLRHLTRDNPKQQGFCALLDELSTRRIALFRESIRLKKRLPEDDEQQDVLQRQVLGVSTEITSVVEQMRGEEQRLLESRQHDSHQMFVLTIIVLSGSFILALVLFSVQYRFLSSELNAREQAERVARESEDALRRVTGRLLQLQDEERRKFSRELHDSLGQYLAGVKMNLDLYLSQQDGNLLTEAIQLLEQSISETRTISHLLHPPLLDEAGFSSAARWYVDGFAQRSNISVNLDLPETTESLPKPVALGLFRILQESLTNIHRHSGSSRADITLTLLPDRAVLKVRDYGRGIPADLLKLFMTQGTNSGVGLAGMRERMRELGGNFR